MHIRSFHSTSHLSSQRLSAVVIARNGVGAVGLSLHHFFLDQSFPFRFVSFVILFD